MKDKNLLVLLEELGFEYIPHRGTTDTFKKENIEIKIPYLTVIVDGTPTHMIPTYDSVRINEVIQEKLNKK